MAPRSRLSATLVGLSPHDSSDYLNSWYFDLLAIEGIVTLLMQNWILPPIAPSANFLIVPAEQRVSFKDVVRLFAEILEDRMDLGPLWCGWRERLPKQYS